MSWLSLRENVQPVDEGLAQEITAELRAARSLVSKRKWENDPQYRANHAVGQARAFARREGVNGVYTLKSCARACGRQTYRDVCSRCAAKSGRPVGRPRKIAP